MSNINDGDDADTTTRIHGDAIIEGCSGDRMIITGDGDDHVEAGDDTISSRPNRDTFVIRDGHGNDDIQRFNPGTDMITLDMAEIRDYQDVLSRMTRLGSDTVITFDNGDILRLTGVRPASLSASNFSYSAGPVCLHEGTLIHTERGDIPIESLRPDDIIWTKDNGWQAIRVVTFERMVFKHRDDPAKPVLIPEGALGSGIPHCDLITSPQHRILQFIEETGEEVLVPAIELAGQNGIRQMRGRKKAHYLNVVMERHSVIQASGCWVESLLVTYRSLDRQGALARKLLDHALGMKPAKRIERRGVRRRHLKSA